MLDLHGFGLRATLVLEDPLHREPASPVEAVHGILSLRCVRTVHATPMGARQHRRGAAAGAAATEAAAAATAMAGRPAQPQELLRALTRDPVRAPVRGLTRAQCQALPRV